MCGTGHVTAIDLYDLVAGLQPPVRGHETVGEDLLDHDTAERRVWPAHDGHAQTRARPRDLHMGHLALQYWQSGDTCN